MIRRKGERRRYGGWSIERELGSGGMGTVYLARRGHDLAALKVIQPGLASDPQFRARFRREVDVSRRVKGPHVAAVIDAGPEDPEPWLAVQYLNGPTLAAHVQAHGRLDERRAVATALSLASALRDIHAVGVIHRDLKPSNVILAATSPVVIDFGIAAAAEATSLTGTGMVLGSAGWMSPEQIRGDEVGTAADVFAWGATIAFAATGNPPFGSARAESATYRAAHDDPTLEGLPDVLRPLVEAALDKDPTRRPQVDDVIEVLSPAAADAPTVAEAVTRVWSPVDGPTTAAPVVPRPMSGKRRWQTATGLLAAAAVVATLGLWRTNSEPIGESPLEADAANAAQVTPVTPVTVSTTTTQAPAPTTTTAPPPAPAPPQDLRFATELPADGRPLSVPLGHLRPGDCFGPVIGLDPVSGYVTRVPCGDPHDAEIAGLVRLPFDAYPGSDAMFSYLDSQCTAVFEDYVGAPIGVEWISLTYAYPNDLEWAGGFREGACSLVGTEGTPMIGSKRDLRG